MFQKMELALLAILGHKSAHSRATGPRIAEPEINNNNGYRIYARKLLKLKNLTAMSTIMIS